MLGRATGIDLYGIDATLIEVEADLGGGLPVITTVGLPDPAVREGVDRIRSAIRHAGFSLPQRRVVVNLAPAGMRKQGAALDLPVAVAILTADGQIPPPGPPGTVLAGELALDGTVRPVRGVISAALAARDAGRERIIVPAANAGEAALVQGIEVLSAGSLAEVAGLGRPGAVQPVLADLAALLQSADLLQAGHDLSEVRGQAFARRALEVAAAGGHNLLLVGPPGAGKTMLARRMPGILPRLGPDEALEVTRVYSAAGLGTSLVTRRPFRAPHHGISPAGLAGGGSRPRPGEVSLATHGVLFLDELPEFRRDVLESLRQPLEDRVISITRVSGTAVLPARFALVGAMNPCPCGYHGAASRPCECSAHEIRRYRGRLSGPLMDRFDLVVEVPALDLAAMPQGLSGERSVTVRSRVEQARSIQRKRFPEGGGAGTNADMDARDLERCAALEEGALDLMRRVGTSGNLSARGYCRVLRVARTLADLAGKEDIGPAELMEALMFRQGSGPAELPRAR